jgi:hypothetical protein
VFVHVRDFLADIVIIAGSIRDKKKLQRLIDNDLLRPVRKDNNADHPVLSGV